MAKLVQDTVSRFEGKLAKNYVPEQFLAKTTRVVEYEKSYLVIKPADFKRKHGVEGSDIGLTLEAAQDEHGEVYQAFILQDTDHVRMRVRHVVCGELAQTLARCCRNVLPRQARQFALMTLRQ